MEIVEPQDRSIFRFVERRLREQMVHPPVIHPELFAVINPVQGDVAERPEHLVGIAVVVVIHFAGVEPNPPQREGRIFRRNADVVFLIHHVPVAAPPCHPCSPAGP